MDEHLYAGRRPEFRVDVRLLNEENRRWRVPDNGSTRCCRTWRGRSDHCRATPKMKSGRARKCPSEMLPKILRAM
eukprot:8243495-Heterocapsa_arctica.AAC.1